VPAAEAPTDPLERLAQTLPALVTPLFALFGVGRAPREPGADEMHRMGHAHQMVLEIRQCGLVMALAEKAGAVDTVATLRSAIDHLVTDVSRTREAEAVRAAEERAAGREERRTDLEREDAARRAGMEARREEMERAEASRQADREMAFAAQQEQAGTPGPGR